jgi:hypothetical protein
MKRIAFIGILIVLMIGSSLWSFADSNIYYNDYAVKLSQIGVFKGTGAGFELEREPTRLEGLIMLIRLIGKEAEAMKLSKEVSAFTDVPDWGRGYVNYAYQNGLAKGIGNNLFGAQDKIDGKSYTTFLLRALGFSDAEKTKDFTWANSIEYAKSIGCLDEDLYFKMIGNKFTRDYVAKSSYNALQQPLKDGTSTLLQKLVNGGAITKAQAESLNMTANIISPSLNNGTVLNSVQIGKLADAVVLINATGYDGSTWTGSGFYTTQDGNLVTNYHVVDGAKTLTITEHDGTVYSGNIKVIGYDEPKDIAVLDIDKTVKLYLNTGNSDQIALGEEIYTIGSPLGLKNTISNGIVSSLREDGIIQISAPISHGSSGGVLLNDKGLAIGITFAGIEAGENLGFAIPINHYTKMSKNLQLDLLSFYNMISKIEQPSNIILKQIAKDEISIYWDKVDSADFYRVLIGKSLFGTYDKLVSSSGSDRWQWASDYCVSASGLEPGVTYYVKIIAVKGNVESPPSDDYIIKLDHAISYQEYESYLVEEYGTLTIDKSTTKFERVYIDGEFAEDALFVSFYVAPLYLDSFLDISIYNRDEIEEELASIAEEMAAYYKKDISIDIIYTRDYIVYPSAFVPNKLYSNTVIYNEKSKTWNVFYPYVNINFYKDSKKYTAHWAY